MSEINVFSKKRTGKDGRSFYTYFGRLARKDGTELSVSVKFKDTYDCEVPLVFPTKIIFDKKDANLSKRTYETEDGNTAVGYTLWLNRWEENPFEDDSLDDFI